MLHANISLLFRLVGCIDTHYTSFESLDPPSFISVKTERINDWNPPESCKRITCIMMIYAGHLNKEIMVAAQCSLNTVKTTRHELENCDGDNEAVARRKQHNRRPYCVGTAEFHEGIGIRAVARINRGYRLQHFMFIMHDEFGFSATQGPRIVFFITT